MALRLHTSRSTDPARRSGLTNPAVFRHGRFGLGVVIKSRATERLDQCEPIYKAAAFCDALYLEAVNSGILSIWLQFIWRSAMPLSGFLEIDDISGESLRAHHENQIEVFGLAWGVERIAPAQVGRGRARARADVGPVEVWKFYDASSPYLALACAQGRTFGKATLYVERGSTNGSHLDYLVITMENVIVTSYDMASGEAEDPDDRLTEAVAFDFEEIEIKYTQIAEDGSAGSEHEVTIDG
jgi:type VI secretion system secreted protein Hcp